MFHLRSHRIVIAVLCMCGSIVEEGMFLTLFSTALADVHILIGPFKELCLNVDVLIPSSGRYCDKPGWERA